MQILNRALILAKKRRLHKSRPERGNASEQAMVRLTRMGMLLSLISASAAIGAVVFSGLQWWEVRSGSKQIDRQIEIASTQAKASKILAAAAQGQVARLADQVTLAQQGLAINERGVRVAERQNDLQNSVTARELANAHAEIGDIPLGLTANADAEYSYSVTNGSPGAVLLRRLLVIAGVTRGPFETPIEIRKRLASTPLISLPIRRGSEEEYRPAIGPYSQADVDDFEAGRATFRLLVAAEIRDAGGRIHHSFACSYAVKLQTKTGHRRADCPVPMSD